MVSGRVRPRYGIPLWRLRQAATLCGLLLLTATFSAPALPGWPGRQQLAGQDLLVTVLDENGLTVPSAHLTLTDQPISFAQKAETDYAGRYQFSNLTPGAYSLRVEKEGFFVFNSNDVRVAETSNLEVTLNHTKEYVESVNVVYSPPAIDPQKTSASAALSSQDIINLPYSVPRDIRYALPMLPGVLQDSAGQLHVAGASTHQIFDELDGFSISDPARGLFDLRVSVDPLQSAEVQSSRIWKRLGRTGELKNGDGGRPFSLLSHGFHSQR